MRSQAKKMKIQKMPKSNLDEMKYHPRYLQVSLGCKLSIFQFLTILENFCAFLQPKLPQPKIAKIPKNRFFSKNDHFLKML